MNQKAKDAFHKTTKPIITDDDMDNVPASGNTTKQNLEENKSIATQVVREIELILKRNAGLLSDEAVQNMTTGDFKIWRESLHELARFFMSNAVMGDFFKQIINKTIPTSKDPAK